MAIHRNKVVIVGSGAVGASVAFDLVVQGMCDELILIDIKREKAWAEATDLQHALAYSQRNMTIRDGSYEDCADADIVVIAAASPYIKGQSRLDMMDKAHGIVKSIVGPVMQSGFHGIFMVITNPVDVMSYYVWKLSGLPAGRVIGTGTALDTARLRYHLANVMGVDPQSVQAFCLGEHGDSQTIPWSLVTVGGKNFVDIIEDNRERLKDVNLDSIISDIANIGHQVVGTKGATTYGIAATTVNIIRTIINNENRVIPISALLQGEYGETDVYIGVPAVISNQGIKELVELRLQPQELLEFKKSVELIREYNRKLPL